MKKALLSLGYILILSFFGCSPKYGITKTYAYTRNTTAGNIPVDENNNPTTSGVQTAHIIFIETASGQQAPVWDTAWVHGKAHTIQPLKIEGNRATPGKTKTDQKDVVIQAAEGNTLWQLMLSPLSGNVYALTSPTAPILIRGTWKGKRFLYEIKKQTELATVFGE